MGIEAAIEVRAAGPADESALAPLLRAAAEEQQRLAGDFQLHPHVEWRQYTRAKLQRPDEHILIAERSGTVVGFLDLRVSAEPAPPRRGRLRATLRRHLPGYRPTPESIVRLPARGYIEDVYVVAEARRRGIGRALLARALAWLAEQHVEWVDAAVWAANAPSRHLFDALGFSPARVLMRRRL